MVRRFPFGIGLNYAMRLERPHIMLFLEDRVLDALSLDVTCHTLCVAGDDTVVVDIGLLVDVAAELTSCHAVVEGASLSIIGERVCFLLLKEGRDCRVVDPEEELLVESVAILIRLDHDWAETEELDLEARVLVVEEPDLFEHELLDVVERERCHVVDILGDVLACFRIDSRNRVCRLLLELAERLADVERLLELVVGVSGVYS